MDLNTKIIEAVRQQPCLYGNSNTLEERCRAWKILATKINVNEQYLKIRWHSLVQRYQSDPNFIYAHQMQFMPRNTNKSPVQQEDCPEFVITEKHLEEQQDDVEDYVFVEVDEDEEKKKAKQQSKEKPTQVKEITNSDKPKSQPEIQNKNVKSLIIPSVRQDRVKSPGNILIKSVETLQKNSVTADQLKNISQIRNIRAVKIVSSNSTIQLNANKLEKPLISNSAVEIKEEFPTKPLIVVEKKKEEAKKVETKREEPKKAEQKKEEPKKEESKKEESKRDEHKKEEPTPAPTPKSRGEDDIFGELVSAMLKPMDETKKKNVKKEIMNLLLT